MEVIDSALMRFDREISSLPNIAETMYGGGATSSREGC